MNTSRGLTLALMAEATAKATFDGYTTIGSFAGFDLRVIKTSEGIKGLLVGKQGYPFKTYSGNTTFMISQLIGVVESIDEKVKLWEHNIVELQKDTREQEKLIAEPFAKQAELDSKRARYNEVMEILNPKEEQSLDSVAEDTVQEQSRAYLEEGYETNSTSWAFDNGIIDKSDRARFYEAVVEISKRGYSVPKTKNGEYIIDNNNKLMFTNGDFKAPTLSKVIVFNDEYETRMAKPKEWIYNEARNTGRLEVAYQAIENMYGEGYVSEFNSRAYKTDAWEDGRGEGSNSRKTSEKTPIREWRFDEQEQERTNTLTDREVLAMAATELETMPLTDAERDALQIFKNRLSRLEDLQEQRAEQGRLYREQQFSTNADHEAAKATHLRMEVLDEQIKKASAAVLSVEDKKVLGDVLKKARKVVESDQRAHDMEILKRYRDRTRNSAAIKKYRERIQKDVGDLSSWILKPNNKDITKHVPDVLKNSVIPFLKSIDFTSKQQLRGGEVTKADKEFVKRLAGLEAALKENIDADGLYSG